jgi:hypothetical protein
MQKLLELLRRIRMLLHCRQFQSDLEEEICLHLDLREKEHVEAGLSGDAARHAAYRRFGNPAAIREESHMTWGWEWLESFFEDIAMAPVRCCVAPYSLLWPFSPSASASVQTQQSSAFSTR